MFIRGATAHRDKGGEVLPEYDYVNQYTTDSSDEEEEEEDDSDNDSDLEQVEAGFKKIYTNLLAMALAYYSSVLKVFKNVDDPSKPLELRDENYYIEPSNFSTYPWIVIKYLELAKKFHSIINTEVYRNLIITIICLAGINVGIQTYPVDKDTFEGLDFAILICFIIEACMKIISEGLRPWHYFTGAEWRWNNFDFLIIIMSLDFMRAIFGGGYAQILRLVRLGKSYKINSV